MPLQLRRRHGSDFWYLRGTVCRIRIDESTRLVDRKAAEQVLALRHAELVKQSVHGASAVKTFAHAALSYLEAGGEAEHVKPLLDTFGTTKLANIDPDMIDRAAKKFGKTKEGKRKAASTLNRQIYTPFAAILHHAATKGWCSKPVVSRPKQPDGRVRWLTHQEAEHLLSKAAPHIRPLLLFMFLTGARLSEALYIDWRDVDLGRSRVSFHHTKNGESRGVPMHSRLLTELQALPHRQGAVFRRPDGKPYAERAGGGGQIKTAWKGMLKRAGITDFRPHDARHTWATWHYAANRDVFALMKLGGWKSEKMVARYAHVNPDNLAGTIDAIWGKTGGPSPTPIKNHNEYREAA